MAIEFHGQQEDNKVKKKTYHAWGERDSEGTQTSAYRARLGMVAATERWKDQVETEKEPRRMLSIRLGSREGRGH